VTGEKPREPKEQGKGAAKAPKPARKAIDDYADRQMKPGSVRGGGYNTK
jgi:hypothetical protein